MSSMQEDVEEEAVTFFEPSSPYYLATMYATLAGLAVFLCCGFLYQASCYKKISATNGKLRGPQVQLSLQHLFRLLFSVKAC